MVARISRLLDDLGATLLEPLALPADSDAEVTAVGIYDALDDLNPRPGELLLGVGLGNTSDDIAMLIGSLGKCGASGLVVKTPVVVDEAISEAVRRSGVALLGLTRAASWTQIAALAQSLLATEDVGGERHDLAGVPAGDFFALANAVAALLDAPVTIEDRSSHVLGFSGRQDEADAGRIETILSRQVPSRYARMLQERGAFRDILQSRQAVYIPPLADDLIARLAIAIRAGDEILGTMWAAVPERPSREREQAFADAAKIVALHMLRTRAGKDVERRLRADLLATVLDGGPGAAEAAARLGVTSGLLCVLAAKTMSGDEAALTATQQRLSDSLAMHLGAVLPRSSVALLGGVVYALLPLDRDDDTAESAVRLAKAFLSRIGDRDKAVIGVGRTVASLPDVARSRRDADQALRVLAMGHSKHPVVRLRDVRVESLLLRVADLLADDDEEFFGPITMLMAYDQEHHTDLVGALTAYLDTFGNIRLAAERVHVHPNTFRYRLRRVAEVGGLDLDDPHARLAALLQLHLRHFVDPRRR